MVKFEKYLANHLIPEWRPAFCNYGMLKRELKRIKPSRNGGSDCQPYEGSHAYFAQNGGPSLQNIRGPYPGDFISVRKKATVIRGSRLDIVESEVLGHPAQAESERLFFQCLDAELKKVNEFYMTKEQEFLEHADILDKQMQALLELKLVVGNRKAYAPTLERQSIRDDDLTAPLLNFNLNDDSVDYMSIVVVLHNEMLFQTIMNQKYTMAKSGLPNMDQLARIKAQLVDIRGMSGKDAIALIRSGSLDRRGSASLDRSRSAHMENFANALAQNLSNGVSNHSRFSEQAYTDSNSCSFSSHDFNAFKARVELSEKMIREAFVEFYRGLDLLRTYSSLNMLAFKKILGMYKKVANSAPSACMRNVDDSYFHTSEEIVKMSNWIEGMYTDHFAHGDRHEARKALKPPQAKAPLKNTFVLGMFCCGSAILFIAFATLLHVVFAKMSKAQQTAWILDYMTSVFPIFSMIALLLLHLYIYGGNLYLWQRMRINYAFIFEFAPGTEMSYQDVLLVCTGLTVLLGGCMLGHLASQQSDSVLIDLIPLGMVLTIMTLLFWPFDIVYRSSRRFFQNCMWRIICAPFYKVLLADFFLGDQLCSQVPSLRNLEYCICYYVGDHFKDDDGEACLDNYFFLDVSYMISVLPYWWRLMQCLRRYGDERDKLNLVNGGKYLSALIVIIVKIQYGKADSTNWMVFYIISSTFATLYQIYWDLVRDWGLLQRNSENPWLRDKLILQDYKCIYFLSMGLNVLLRFPWVLSITGFQFGGLDSHLTDFLLAALEVIRRGQWNFYRLENEHLNNVGHYRAIKTVPLPFVH